MKISRKGDKKMWLDYYKLQETMNFIDRCANYGACYHPSRSQKIKNKKRNKRNKGHQGKR